MSDVLKQSTPDEVIRIQVRAILADRVAWKPIGFIDYDWRIDWQDVQSNMDENRRREACKRLGAYIAHVTKVEAENASRLAELIQASMRALKCSFDSGDTELGQAGATIDSWIREDWRMKYHGRSSNRFEITGWASKQTRRYDLLPRDIREMRKRRSPIESEDVALRTALGDRARIDGLRLVPVYEEAEWVK